MDLVWRLPLFISHFSFALLQFLLLFLNHVRIPSFPYYRYYFYRLVITANIFCVTPGFLVNYSFHIVTFYISVITLSRKTINFFSVDNRFSFCNSFCEIYFADFLQSIYWNPISLNFCLLSTFSVGIYIAFLYLLLFLCPAWCSSSSVRILS